MLRSFSWLLDHIGQVKQAQACLQIGPKHFDFKKVDYTNFQLPHFIDTLNEL